MDGEKASRGKGWDGGEPGIFYVLRLIVDHRYIESHQASFRWWRSGIVIWCYIQLVGTFWIEFPWSSLNNKVANCFLNPSMKGIFSFLPCSSLPSCYEAYTIYVLWLWQVTVQSPLNGQGTSCDKESQDRELGLVKTFCAGDACGGQSFVDDSGLSFLGISI